MKINSEIVIDCLWGDSGKGKVVSCLLSKKNIFGKNKYDYCMRTSGGPNCGHTIYINKKKFITHIIPAGIFYNIKSIIGCGCVLNVSKFFEEIKYLEENEFYNCKELIKIAYNTHIITEKHIQEDIENENSNKKIGSTRQGIMPAYRDKYARTGIRAQDVKELKQFTIDTYEELFNNNRDINILFEGAQGTFLDIDQGDYPFVTSSNCGVGAVINNGIPFNSIKNVYGVVKSYATYVGEKKFQPEGEIFNKIQEAGNEFGATTKRKRQCSLLDMDLVNKAIDINGVNILIINKMDILRIVNYWAVFKGGEKVEFQDEKQFKKFIKKNIKCKKIIFSYSPDRI